MRYTLRPQHWLRHGKALANRQIGFRHCVRSTACISCRCRREIAEAPPVADAARRFRGSAPIGGHDSGCRSDGTTVLPQRHSRIFAKGVRVTRFCRSSSCTSCRSRREIAEAPPVADAARRFRGSAPIGGHDSGCRSDGTTVLPQRHSRIFAKGVRVTRFCRSSSCTSCRSRRGRGRSARSSAPCGAASSRCRHRPRSRSCPWLPAHA